MGLLLLKYIRDWLQTSGQAQEPEHPIFCQVRKFGRKDQAVYRVVNPEKSLSGVAMWELVKWYCQQANVKSKIVPHSFRVAMITDSLEGGAPIQHVQKVTGHATTEMITEVYDRNVYADPVARYRKKPLLRRGERPIRGEITQNPWVIYLWLSVVHISIASSVTSCYQYLT